jgi:hypothetical protein
MDDWRDVGRNMNKRHQGSSAPSRGANLLLSSLEIPNHPREHFFTEYQQHRQKYYDNKWEEYERRKRCLPWISPEEYDREVLRIAEELGI